MEDKELKELLTKWAVQQPSAHFTSQVMERITSTYSFKTSLPYKQKVLQILCGVFILVFVALLTLCFTTPVAMPFQFNVKLPDKYLIQGFSFLITFWVVMLLNLTFKRLSFNRYHT